MAIILLMNSTAHSNECVGAASLKVNQAAPCSGLLISNDQAKSCLKCKNIEVPSLKELLKCCNQKNETLNGLNVKLEKRATDLIKVNNNQYELSTMVMLTAAAFAVGTAVGLFASTGD